MVEDNPYPGFAEEQAVYKSGSQNARVLTEGWVASQLYCPSCGERPLEKYPNNRPVADFACRHCGEDYELKAKRGGFGRKVADGAYGTMMEQLRTRKNPNLLLMSYDQTALRPTNLIVVPRQFFTDRAIECRPKLSSTARRAGWQGCNILLSAIPEVGKIWLLRDRQLIPKAEVLENWRRIQFLRDQSLAARGWFVDVLKCVEGLGRREFRLEDVYGCEAQLSALYPENRNVRPKIRQQLQRLRDHGLIEFTARGEYSLRD